MASKVEKRRREIMGIVQTEGTVYVKELAALFKVTKETIRGDFDYLVNQYGYIRIHGGIKKVTEDTTTSQYQYQDHTQVNIDDKKQLCYRAMDLFHDGDCIYVDGGSTVSYLLNYINRRSNLTVVTPSIAFLMKYQMDGYDRIFKEGGHRLLFVGGNIDSNILTTFGPFFDQTVEAINFDAMILSADGVDMEQGVTNRDEVAFSVIKRVQQRAARKILLVDHSKFDEVHRYKTLGFQDLDYIVTEKDLDKGWVELLESQRVVYYKA